MSFGGRALIFLRSLPTTICEQPLATCSSLTDTAWFLSKQPKKFVKKKLKIASFRVYIIREAAPEESGTPGSLKGGGNATIRIGAMK